MPISSNAKTAASSSNPKLKYNDSNAAGWWVWWHWRKHVSLWTTITAIEHCNTYLERQHKPEWQTNTSIDHKDALGNQ
jgi:hypothetical protein